MARRLIITADDFGIGYDTSRGIVDAHLAGAVDATSVMTATGDHLERSLPLLNNAPNLQLGLHLTLTSRAAKPLVATTASGFVGEDGYFFTLNKLALLSFRKKIDLDAVQEEILAQTERFERLLGRRPAHIDGHHHAHQLRGVSHVVALLADKGRLPKRIRNTIEPGSIRKNVRGERVRRLAIEGLGARSNTELSSVRGVLTDGFLSILSPDMLKQPNPWGDYIKHLPPAGVYEMGVHPGHPDSSLHGRDTYLLERAIELEALISQLNAEARQRLDLLAPSTKASDDA